MNYLYLHLFQPELQLTFSTCINCPILIINHWLFVLIDSADPDEIDDEHLNQMSPVSPVKKSKKDPMKDSLPMYQAEIPRSPVKGMGGADMMPPSGMRMVCDT